MLPHTPKIISLDGDYNIDEDSWVVIIKPGEPIITDKIAVVHQSIAAYGISGKTTQITLLEKEWITDDESFDAIRGTVVYAQSEEIELAEEPIVESVGYCVQESNEANGLTIELDGLYEDLEPGRWIIISGEREIEGTTTGVRFNELTMLNSVTQGVIIESQDKAGINDNDNENDSGGPRSGEKIHTFIQLANNLAYCFKRDTVNIYGNVVKATHGETRREVLGSGEGSKALQSFDLKQKPLTYVSASNPAGVDSTLKVFVNNIRWHEADSLAALEPNDRRFITKADNEDKTSVIFGNGEKGVRLPTGIENIRVEYRNGIGSQGNVKAAQISLLTTKPLGVKEVINPLRASGGANREARDSARKNVPLAVKALDRLVSVQDYEDFSRIYAGIGKAHAVELSNGRQQLVHITIAGAEDIPIDQNSELFINLRQALHDFGDSHQGIKLDIRELMLIVIEAGVAILPDYQWESVVTDLRTRLLDALSFDQRELGQDVTLSEVISTMQSVPGVAFVDVDTFGGIPEKIADTDGKRRMVTPEEVSEAVECMTVKWSHVEMESFCSNGNNGSAHENNECIQFDKCQKYGHFDGIKGVRQRLQVNLAEFEKEGVIRPAQIAFLTPDVPATLILNQIK